MSDLLIVGTDTDVGKTSFALLWMTAYGSHFDYWKPLETGPADSDTLAKLLPQATIHRSLFHFDEPVAPLLAARRRGIALPLAGEIAARRPTPTPGRGLLIETFGGPFSPLNETELQIALIQALKAPVVLISSSKVGAVGRTIQAVRALDSEDIHPDAIVLLGPRDPFAEETLKGTLTSLAIFSLQIPDAWTRDGFREQVNAQKQVLHSLAEKLACGFATRIGPTEWMPSSALDLVAKPQASPPAADWIARDRASVWHPYTPLQSEDPLLARGVHEEWIQLADGRRVIDGISSWWTILHGHRHPPLVRAFHEALQSWDHVHFAGVTHPPAIELAELLLGTMPWTGGRAFYSDNGSTSVEVALKLAYQTWRHRGEPERTRFIGFEHGYHGDTFGAMAVGRDPLFFGQFEPLLFQADMLPLNPERLDDHLRKHAKQTAAIIVEPRVQGAGGMTMHTAETLNQLAEVARKNDVLFIADEVMTGGGRTGTLWAFQSAGIEPDSVCASKTLTGGMMPLAATLVSPGIVREFDHADRAKTFFHGHSFTAHPLACAVAAANWRLLTENFPAAPRQMEAFWKLALAPLQEVSGIAEVRMLGSIAAIEFDCPGGYLAAVGQKLRASCLDDGVLPRPLGSVLYAMPPYCTSNASLEKIADAMVRATK